MNYLFYHLKKMQYGKILMEGVNIYSIEFKLNQKKENAKNTINFTT